MEYLDINTCFGSLPWRRFDVGPEKLVELLGRGGTAQAVTMSLAGAFLSAEEGNSRTLQACKEHRQFLAAATVDPRTYFGRENLIRRAADEGFVLLRLFNGFQGWPINFAPLEVIFEEAHEAGLPVMLDRTTFGDITQACRLGSVTDTPVILSGVGYHGLSEIVVCMTEYANLYVETSRLSTPDGLRILCEEIGPERILFGTGAALNALGPARMTLDQSGLSPEEIRAVASLNALKLLGRT